MNPVRLWTLTKKECHRFLKVWLQTIMSPIIIAVLYFAVFGAAFSSRIVEFSGIPYLAFIVPGLALLQSTVNAFQNPSSSIIISEYHGTISDLLVSPLTGLEKTIGYFLGGLARGMMVTIVIFLIAFFFIPDFVPQHPLWLFWMCFLANGIFSLLGTIAGIWAKTFDQISGFTTFLITPHGVFRRGILFYGCPSSDCAKTHPPQPILLFCRWFALGIFWGFGFNPVISFAISIAFFVVFFLITWWAFSKDWRMKK
jgi:ABC-2 type transport system permease protein